ncbi:MAG: Fic family protein [Fibromonadaceae bacterium]|jgi:Fic family protein|nr:Fic family protein [Fibromonadaceae bacterium]
MMKKKFAIHSRKNWTEFSWNEKLVSPLLNEVIRLQGKLCGLMLALGFSQKTEAMLNTLTLDVLKSSEIEGEKLNYEQVRSSIARRLGMDVAGMVKSNRAIDGVVEMMLDATQNFKQSLTEKRLCEWHTILFSSGYGPKILIGKYREEEMQIVSGRIGHLNVHYEAPKPGRLLQEMSCFLEWFNNENKLNHILKSAISHFWFVTIHPFDDGNGRIARAISDMMLARSDNSSQRFYSMSAQILKERKKYYDVLEVTQHGNSDITQWLLWFLECLKKALFESEKIVHSVIFKANFWDKHRDTPLNSRQRLMLNKLLDGFHGKLQSSKWAKIAKCSPDSALRDIKDLLDKGILKQDLHGGRSTAYELASFP